MRLRRLQEEYGPRLTVAWRAFPLRPEDGQSVSTPHVNQSRLRALLEEDSPAYKPWPEGKLLPSSSLPALEATKAAQLQGPEAFERLHWRLFRAYFEENQDIGQREVLLALAEEVKLDVAHLAAALESRSLRDEVLADYAEALRDFPGFGIPLALFGGRYPVMGAVPVEMYRRPMELLLRGRAQQANE